MEFIELKHRQMLSKYNHTMENRRRFMRELKEMRGKKTQLSRKEIKKNIGPKWYQVLSVRQRTSLDALSRAIYQDILEGRPVRTMEIIRVLGILPRPNKMAVQHCMYLGRNDPKEFLAQLFNDLYNHPFNGERYSYDLNMRIILTSIFYLGLDEIISSLREQFKPDKSEPPTPTIVKKRRTPVCSSPYLQKMVAPLYTPALFKRKLPPPLPDLSFLNQPFEEEPPPPPILKPAPPPPPPPPPKKRINREQCDKLAGMFLLQQDVPKKKITSKPVVKKPPSYRRLKSSKTSLHDVKKKYGLRLCRKRKKNIKKPIPPSTGVEIVQFMIAGVYIYKESSYYIIGTIYTLPTPGILVNGGHTQLPNGEYGLINLGWSCRPSPDPDDDHCECSDKWDSAVFRHIRNTKCYCGHRYDFGNEGTFPEEELPLFVPPTRRQPMQFNYNTIYQMDPKVLQIQKEGKKIWDTESILQEDDDSEMAVRRRKKKKKKEVQNPEQIKTCLGDKPDLEDYLRCGLRLQGRTNVAARLPDVHLAPELRAWMWRRVYGPYTTEQKASLIKSSLTFWSYFKAFQNVGRGKAKLPSDPSFSADTSWKHKFEINKQFKNVVHKYKIDLYTAQAYTNNLLWATTYDAEYPDEKFREIFFTYLSGNIADVDIFHPYCRYENAEQVFKRQRNRYICSAKGAGDLERF